MYTLLEGADGPPDLVIVVGGFNSSNTGQLLEISSRYAPAYHIREAADLTSATTLIHKPYMRDPVVGEAWLGAVEARRRAGEAVTIGFTGGASTPNRVIGEAMIRALSFLGVAESHIDAVVNAG
jgi:4-hydroxy-3-methylbut-2-enyl diphosphate reductase